MVRGWRLCEGKSWSQEGAQRAQGRFFGEVERWRVSGGLAVVRE